MRNILVATLLAAITCLPAWVYAAASTFPTAFTQFTVFGTTVVTNIGNTEITGDLGLDGGTDIPGLGLNALLSPGVVKGLIHINDENTVAARNAIKVLYNQLATQPCDASLETPRIGTMKITPGVTCVKPSILILDHSTITFDGEGNPQSKFIIKTPLLAVGHNVVMKLIGDAQVSNIFWIIDRAATLEADQFVGNLITGPTGGSISISNHAKIFGRVQSLNGAVTLDNNKINPVNPDPTREDIGIYTSP